MTLVCENDSTKIGRDCLSAKKFVNEFWEFILKLYYVVNFDSFRAENFSHRFANFRALIVSVYESCITLKFTRFLITRVTFNNFHHIVHT